MTRKERCAIVIEHQIKVNKEKLKEQQKAK